MKIEIKMQHDKAIKRLTQSHHAYKKRLIASTAQFSVKAERFMKMAVPQKTGELERQSKVRMLRNPDKSISIQAYVDIDASDAPRFDFYPKWLEENKFNLGEISQQKQIGQRVKVGTQYLYRTRQFIIRNWRREIGAELKKAGFKVKGTSSPQGEIF